MASATDFAKMVPGFDFLSGLMKNAGTGLPNIGQWVAPTLDPAELDKRIGELKTVQFWLEQNARLLGTTIQALEVQRMTLSTLQTMNLPLAELRDALTLPARPAAPEPAAAPPAASRAADPVAEPDDDDGENDDDTAAAPPAAPRRRVGRAARAADGGAASKPAPPAIDPMQWWGALTQQFTQLAAQALKDSAGDATRQMAGAVVKQSIDNAGQALGAAARAATAPMKAAAGLAAAPVKAAARAARSKPAAKAPAKRAAARTGRNPR